MSCRRVPPSNQLPPEPGFADRSDLLACFWCERAVPPPGFLHRNRASDGAAHQEKVVPGRTQYQVSDPVSPAISTDRRLFGTLRVRRYGRRQPIRDGLSWDRKCRESHGPPVGLAHLSHPVCSAKRPCQGRSTLCASHPGFDKSANIEGGRGVRPRPGPRAPKRDLPPMMANRGDHPPLTTSDARVRPMTPNRGR